jgi:hypothetical protein
MDGILVGLSFGKIEPACPFLLFPSFIKIIFFKKKTNIRIIPFLHTSRNEHSKHAISKSKINKIFFWILLI